ncbi:Anaerobic regulatory protein [compost metagenome]|jgi:CRP-like cAMP-binding protein|nr:Crp/Fnr family transcriptional regulator [uncultured Brevundimonas sp.]
MSSGQNPTQGLISKLERRDRLSQDEREVLEGALDVPVFHPSGSVIVEAGAWPDASSLLVSGLAARVSGLLQGARTVTQLSVAGDFLDLHSLVMKQIDHGVVAVSDCITATIPHGRLRDIAESFPHLGRMLLLEVAVDGAIQREWFHRLGRQDALARMAHLLCELDARLGIVGLSDEKGFSLALTQADFADCLGLTAVHVNRTLKELRRLGLVVWHDGRVVIEDRERLQELAEFDPTYLRLHSAPV